MDRKLRNLAPQGGSRSDLGVKTRQARLYTGSKSRDYDLSARNVNLRARDDQRAATTIDPGH